jgi:hypothetical protein
MQVTPWSPLREPVHQIKQIILHLIDLQNVLLSFSWFAIVILAGIIVYLPRRGSVGTDSSLFALTILTLAVLAALYLPILVDGRYFWVCSTLLLCAGALFTGRLFREASLVPWQRLVVLLFLWASFAVYPLGSLVHLFRDGEVLAAQVMEFTAAYPLTSTRIAADSWKQGLYVSGYSDAVFYGVPRKSASTEEMERELLMHGIQYYLTWREPMGTFRSYSLLPASTLPGVGVYIRSDE